MGYTGPIRSAKFSTGVTEIMTQFVAPTPWHSPRGDRLTWRQPDPLLSPLTSPLGGLRLRCHALKETVDIVRLAPGCRQLFKLVSVDAALIGVSSG
jgi:hypothetical protein